MRLGRRSGDADRLARRAIDLEIARLALPALGALAADPLVSLVDTAFVGRLGAVELAALGVDTAIFGIAFFLFNFLAYGTTAMVAAAVGRGDGGRDEAVRRIVGAAVALAVALGIVSTLVLVGGAPWLVRIMGAAPEVRPGAIDYLRIRALAVPAVLLVTAGHGAYRGLQDTRTPFLFTLGLNAVNLVLDPLLIFGAGMGLRGAALATVIAQWLGAGAFLIGLARGGVLRWAVPRGDEVRRLLQVGGLLTGRTLALVSAFTVATAVAARVGTVTVAAHQVASQLWLFLALVVDAIAIAGQALVGRELGRGDRVYARRLADRMLAWGLAVGVVLGLAFWAGRGLLPSLFTADPEVAELVRSVLPFVAAMQPLNAVVFVADGIFIGAQDFAYLFGAMVVAAASAIAVLALVVPLGWGLTGIWWGIVVLMATRAMLLAVRYPRVFGART